MQAEESLGVAGADPGLEPLERALHHRLRRAGPHECAVGALPEQKRERIDEQLRLGPAQPGEAPLRLDLFKSLAYATSNSRQYQTQMEALYLAACDDDVRRVLEEVGATDVPVIDVYNKIDTLSVEEQRRLRATDHRRQLFILRRKG